MLLERAGKLRDITGIERRKAANTARREQLAAHARYDGSRLPVFEQTGIDGQRDQRVGANRGVDPGALGVARLADAIVWKVRIVAPKARTKCGARLHAGRATHLCQLVVASFVGERGER